jgi:hypothetical protein
MVADLWDMHLRSGVRNEERETARDPEVDAELIKKFKEFRKQPTLPPGQIGTDEEDMISIARSVHRKRGSWCRRIYRRRPTKRSVASVPLRPFRPRPAEAAKVHRA